ncbi:hypothetical protein QOZ80_7AG0556870 [Eleusine coracana subsp. coracana]|nr:hypothetical protein QOZ80_7AG0556870 [Eleusine coracana subsp. coracana]
MRGMFSPNFSSMLSSSGATPSGSLHANPCSTFGNVTCTILSPSERPGHIHQPKTNDSSPKSWPFPSTPLPTNRYNLNSADVSQDAGSRPIDHALTSMRVPAGMTWPPLHVASRDRHGFLT